MRRSILLACVAALVTSSFTLSACATGANAYVALGDSYTAGTLIPNTAPEPESFGCMRSDHNYPHLVRRQIDLRVFADVSCSGAKTDNMLLPQQEPLETSRSNPPQFEALEGRRARAVSITIGGNDAGIGDLISGPGCTSPNPASNTPCQDQYVVNGHDRLSGRIAASAPKVLRVLEGIHSRAPRATVFLLNYLNIVPPNGTTGCSIFEGGDIKWFNAREVELNTMLKNQAKAANAAATSANEKPYVVYVDAYRGSIGHDACQPTATRWIEPRTNAALAFQLHPNATGMAKGYAEPLLAAMRAAGIAP